MPLYLTETSKAVHLAGVFLTAQERAIKGKYYWTDIEKVSFSDGEEEYDDELINLNKLFGYGSPKKRYTVEIHFELKNGRKFSFVHRHRIRRTGTIGGGTHRYATKGETERFKENFLTLFENSKKAPEPEETDEDKKRKMLGAEVWVFFICCLIVYMYFIPAYTMGVERSGIHGFLMFVIPLFLFPFLVYKTVRSIKPSTKWRFWIPLATPFIVMPIYVSYMNGVADEELRENGIWMKGKVIEEWRKQKNRDSVLEKFCVFTVGGETYKSIIDQKNLRANEYANGTDIAVIYSKSHPNINRFGYWADNYK